MMAETDPVKLRLSRIQQLKEFALEKLLAQYGIPVFMDSYYEKIDRECRSRFPDLIGKSREVWEMSTWAGDAALKEWRSSDE